MRLWIAKYLQPCSVSTRRYFRGHAFSPHRFIRHKLIVGAIEGVVEGPGVVGEIVGFDEVGETEGNSLGETLGKEVVGLRVGVEVVGD